MLSTAHDSSPIASAAISIGVNKRVWRTFVRTLSFSSFSSSSFVIFLHSALKIVLEFSKWNQSRSRNEVLSHKTVLKICLLLSENLIEIPL